jgi:DNA (cytosine-5)-methyltransferase 1
MLTNRGLGTVLGDLAAMGFDAKWGVLGAADVGANHQRDRIWIVAKYSPPPPPEVAYTDSTYEQRHKRTERTQSEYTNIDGTSKLAYTKNQGYVRWFRCMGTTQSEYNNRGSQINGRGQWWQVEPNVGRVADGVAARVDRLKAIGNGQVPFCAATAWRILSVA